MNLDADGPVSIDFAAAMLAASMKTAVESARLYPRDPKKARKAILKLCRDARFAEAATYTVENEGGTILRPSINFARPAADAWGHIHTGSRIIRTSANEEHVEAWAFDAQAMRTVTQPGLLRKIVKRKDPETHREVWVRLEGPDLLAARHREVSIVVRRAILDLLPAQLVDEAMEACERALDKAASESMQKEPIPVLADLLEGWWTQGVREQHLERYLGKPLADLTPKDLVRLAGQLRGVREGSISVAPFLREPLAEVAPPVESEPVSAPPAAPAEPTRTAEPETPPAPSAPRGPLIPPTTTPRPIDPNLLSDDAWNAA